VSCASKGPQNILTFVRTGFGAAWAGMLVFDSLVFCMTLYKSIVLPRPNGVNILDILLRDGELYLLRNLFSSFNLMNI
jgi:hypothetical protein